MHGTVLQCILHGKRKERPQEGGGQLPAGPGDIVDLLLIRIIVDTDKILSVQVD